MGKVQSAVSPGLAVVSLFSGAAQGYNQRRQQIEMMQFEERMQANDLAGKEALMNIQAANQQELARLQTQHAIAVANNDTVQAVELEKQMGDLRRNKASADNEVDQMIKKENYNNMLDMFVKRGVPRKDAESRAATLAYGAPPATQAGRRGGGGGPKKDPGTGYDPKMEAKIYETTMQEYLKAGHDPAGAPDVAARAAQSYRAQFAPPTAVPSPAAPARTQKVLASGAPVSVPYEASSNPYGLPPPNFPDPAYESLANPGDGRTSTMVPASSYRDDFDPSIVPTEEELFLLEMSSPPPVQ